MNSRYNDSICSQRCCHYNEFAAVKNPKWIEWYLRKTLFYSYFLIEHMFSYFLESLQRGDSNKYPKHMLLEVLNAMFLHNFSLLPLERRFRDIQIVIFFPLFRKHVFVKSKYTYTVKLQWLDHRWLVYRSLRKHAYSNILKMSPPKTESFRIKKKIWFLL